ncbi:poly(A) RNA polymerase, mitochondrial-like isoform X2 [Artemia franciscana]
MADRGTASEILKSAVYTQEVSVVPVRSRFLWLKSNGSLNHEEVPNRPIPIQSFEPPDSQSLTEALLSCNDVSSQMELFYGKTKLTELEIRLRFLVCDQVESAFKGIFPNGRVVPFGSSVNGCGRSGTDLDMVFECYNNVTKVKEGTSGRLIFHAKTAIANNRPLSKHHMEIMADILKGFLPGPSQIRRILNARVPIIKFLHEYTNVECDLSSLNMTGFYMSELLYLYGEVDSRFRPLIFTVRHWAKEVLLTSDHPGQQITNFSLTLLVIYFLQTRALPILPTLGSLIKGSATEDVRSTEGIDCTFVRDLRRIEKSENPAALQDLLVDFFNFLSTFPFDERGISIITGKPIVKKEKCAILIQNPLERDLNVTKNVDMVNLRKLVNEAQSAKKSLSNLGRNDKTFWGLLSFKSSNVKVLRNRTPVCVENKEEIKTKKIETEIRELDPVVKSALEKMKSRAKLSTQTIKTSDRKRTVVWKY